MKPFEVVRVMEVVSTVRINVAIDYNNSNIPILSSIASLLVHVSL